jgi:hypothetical protein
VVGHSRVGMVAALWTAGHRSCPLAVNLDGHGNPTGADQFAGLDQHGCARARQVLQSCLAPMAAALPAAARCRLVVVSARQSMAELLPAPAQEPWRAYERWVRLQL